MTDDPDEEMTDDFDEWERGQHAPPHALAGAMNAYLSDYLAIGGWGTKRFRMPPPAGAKTRADVDHRWRLINKYGFAVPNEAAIRECVNRSPIIEIGAGLGYWAKLITEAGGDVVCFDDFSWEWRDGAAQWFEVRAGGPEKVEEHPDRALFLCWPPLAGSCLYPEEKVYDMAADALGRYRGRAVIVVGEGEGGCTAGAAFFALLEGWREVAEVAIPRWFGINDWLRVYERAVDNGAGP